VVYTKLDMPLSSFCCVVSSRSFIVNLMYIFVDHYRRVKVGATKQRSAGRSLMDLTADSDIFCTLHRHFVYILKRGGSRLRESMVEGPPQVYIVDVQCFGSTEYFSVCIVVVLWVVHNFFSKVQIEFTFCAFQWNTSMTLPLCVVRLISKNVAASINLYVIITLNL